MLPKDNKRLLTTLIKEFYPHAKGKLGFTEDCRVSFKEDGQNAEDPFGKTAYYLPEEKKIVIFVTNRHPKDVLRSFSHELVHHRQNCDGKFANNTPTTEGYAQNDKHLREMEKEAYLEGNLLFRDYEDARKSSLDEEYGQFGSPKGLEPAPIRQEEVDKIKQVILQSPQATYAEIIEMSGKVTGLPFGETQRHVNAAFTELEETGEIEEMKDKNKTDKIFEGRREKLTKRLTEAFAPKVDEINEITGTIMKQFGGHKARVTNSDRGLEIWVKLRGKPQALVAFANSESEAESIINAIDSGSWSGYRGEDIVSVSGNKLTIVNSAEQDLEMSGKVTGLPFGETQRHVNAAFTELEETGEIEEMKDKNKTDKIFEGRREKLTKKLTETFTRNEERSQPTDAVARLDKFARAAGFRKTESPEEGVIARWVHPKNPGGGQADLYAVNNKYYIKTIDFGGKTNELAKNWLNVEAWKIFRENTQSLEEKRKEYPSEPAWSKYQQEPGKIGPLTNPPKEKYYADTKDKPIQLTRKKLEEIIRKVLKKKRIDEYYSDYKPSANRLAEEEKELDEDLIEDIKDMIKNGESKDDIFQQMVHGENMELEVAAQHYLKAVEGMK